MLAALAALSLLTTECHSRQGYEGPPPRQRPAEASVPVQAPPFVPADLTLTNTLDRAAMGFAGRAPAWSLAVARPGRGLWSQTIGAEPGARFHAASIGKSMTAAVILQLVEEGRLTLDDTLDTWFADLPNAALVTIDHLLSNRSGYFLQREEPQGPTSGDDITPEATFKRLHSGGVLFCPGTNWAYSNVGYMLLGRIIEMVDGQSFEAALTHRLLEPLGLRDTLVLTPETADPRLVDGHDGGAPVDGPRPGQGFAAAPVATTAEDLVRWWRALLTGEVVSAQTLDLMTRRSWPLFGSETLSYGRGMQIAHFNDGPGPMIMHSGGIDGFSATVAWLPAHNSFAAVLVNDRSVPAEAALWALVRALPAAPPQSPAPRSRRSPGPPKRGIQIP